jgi:hypothetical protein
VHTTVLESVSCPDLERHLEKKAIHGAASYLELIDAREVKVKFTSEETQDILVFIKKAAESHPLGPVAVLVDDDLGFAMMKMIGRAAESDCAIEVFRNPADAQRWLHARKVCVA